MQELAGKVAVVTGSAQGLGKAIVERLATAGLTVVAADVNGDSALDLISANSGTNALMVLTNNGSGGFGAAIPYYGGNNTFALAVAVEQRRDAVPGRSQRDQVLRSLSVVVEDAVPAHHIRVRAQAQPADRHRADDRRRLAVERERALADEYRTRHSSGNSRHIAYSQWWHKFRHSTH